MKIHFIGLSCFLIENDSGFRILIDPFNDQPEWSLGLTFPTTFKGSSFGTNIVLMSEPDADHSYSKGDWLQYGPETKPNCNPFPNFDLKGTIVYEYHGDLNIAYHYTIDGLRLAHFADNAHLLTEQQCAEIGSPDIVFMSPPKVPGADGLEIVRKNIEMLKPKIIMWTHHIVPPDLPKTTDSQSLRNYFIKYFKENASTNQFYEGEDSFIQLCYILENAFILNTEYSGIIVSETSITIDKNVISTSKEKIQSYLFTSMLAE
ncbi:MAG TPA: MBL fold metallo-hydrolase [bacterium]|nr:MBL fold metallo-hydrolase [bacterium]